MKMQSKEVAMLTLCSSQNFLKMCRDVKACAFIESSLGKGSDCPLDGPAEANGAIYSVSRLHSPTHSQRFQYEIDASSTQATQVVHLAKNQMPDDS
jgi:hypothetical protein